MFGTHGDQCEHCAYLERQFDQIVAHLFELGQQANRTQRELRKMFDSLKEMLIVTQADVDTETAAVNAEADKNEAAFVNIQAEIVDLENQIAAGNTPDLTGLKAAVAKLQGSDTDVASLETPAPTEPTA